MDNAVIVTERLSLRKMTTDDVQNLMAIFTDPVTMRYYPSTMNEEETLSWIHRTLNNYEKLGVGFWVVEDKMTGKFLGQCGLIPQEYDEDSVMEIAYLFVRQVWGNGYASESAKNVNNTASARVAERNGMHVEKTITKWGKDVLVYSVSRGMLNA